MPPRPASPAMDSMCGRESPVSPPMVVAPVAVKPTPLSDAHAAAPVATDQQRLLYQLALAERLRLASAGLAWARPPLSAHHHYFQDASMGANFMGGLGLPVMGGLGSVVAGAGAMGGTSTQVPPAAYPTPHPFYSYRLLDPRVLLPRGPEEPKPQHSYIGLIAMAILSSPDKKLVLSDIYQYILDHYAYFRSRGPGWRNSIRHNLSLNDCFIKSGRSANGKGHYWAIHPANIDDFRRGDFRRRRAQRRVRKHLGLPVDDDSDPEALSPSPAHTPAHDTPAPELPAHDTPTPSHNPRTPTTDAALRLIRPKRQFDVLSLLAPDRPPSQQTDGGEALDDDQCMDVTDFQQRLQPGQEHAHHLAQHLHFKLPAHRLEATEDQRPKVTEDHLQQVREEHHHQLQGSGDQCDHVDRPCHQLGQHHLQVNTHQHLVAEVNHNLQVSSCHHLRVAENLHLQGEADDCGQEGEQQLQGGEDPTACTVRSRQPAGEEEEEEDLGGRQPSTPPCWLAGAAWPHLAHVTTLTTSCKLSTTTLTTPYKLSATALATPYKLSTATLVSPCQPSGEKDDTVEGSPPAGGSFSVSPPTAQQQRPVAAPLPTSLASSPHPAHTLISTSPHSAHTLTSTSALPTHTLISTPPLSAHTLTSTSTYPTHTLNSASLHPTHILTSASPHPTHILTSASPHTTHTLISTSPHPAQTLTTTSPHSALTLSSASPPHPAHTLTCASPPPKTEGEQ